MIEIKALVADDDPQLQDIMVRRLQKAGLNPDRANDGHQALMLIENTNYDLVVTDIYMPGATGLELLRRVKEKDPHCQVIVVTAAATLDNAVDALNKGAFGYMTKPFDHISVFNSMIARALEFRKLILSNQRLAAAQRKRGDLLEAEVTKRVQQLRQQHKGLMDLLGALPDGVLVVGDDGRIKLRSPVAEKWLTEELKSENQPIRDFVVKSHTAGGSWETQVRLGEHELLLRSEDLPSVEKINRRVVVIRDIGSQEVDFDSRLVEPLTKIRRSIDWLEKNQQRSDLSSSIEFLKLQIEEIDRLAQATPKSDEPPSDVKSTDSPDSETDGTQMEIKNSEKKEVGAIDPPPEGDNGRTKSGKLTALPAVEHTIEPVTDVSDMIRQVESKGTVENEDEEKSEPIATKLFSEEEIESAYEGKPDPIEREKAFEKLIAMLEGGATVGVSGGEASPNSGLATKEQAGNGSGTLSAVRDNKPWPPLPPSREK